MYTDFPLFPEAASSFAREIDLFYFALVGLSAAMSLLIAGLVVYLALKYRRRDDHEIGIEYQPNPWLEYTWIVLPLIVFIGIFLWGAKIYVHAAKVPEAATEVWITGKQWMWKAQHLSGPREINELHLPVGQPVKLIMISEDVIHDFYVPEFRVHTDVLPHRYMYQWFQPTKVGTYNIFCSEYCGTDHSKMIGKVHVMEPTEYQRWLAGGPEGSPAAEGKKLFEHFACNTCHMEGSGARGPQLEGVFGSSVLLADGSRVAADENYLRESILNPAKKVVAGYQPIMPTFQGQVDETQLMQLITYIKSLGAEPEVAPIEAQPPAVESGLPVAN